MLGLSCAGHQEGTVNVEIRDSDFVPLWDEQYVIMNLGKGVHRARGGSLGKHQCLEFNVSSFW